MTTVTKLYEENGAECEENGLKMSCSSSSLHYEVIEYYCGSTYLPISLIHVVSNCFFARSQSHESAAAQQVGVEEEAGHQSSEGHRSTAHSKTHH